MEGLSFTRKALLFSDAVATLSGTMRRLSLWFCSAAIACLPFTAFALDAGPSVKVTPILKTTQSWDGKPLVYPKGQAEITGMIIEIAPGAQTGWHLHPVPSFGVMLEGNLTVTLKSGQRKRLKAGDAIAEVVNTLHNGRNTGKGPVKILVFYAGVKNKNLTEKQ